MITISKKTSGKISKKEAKARKAALKADLDARAAEVKAAKKELRPKNDEMKKRRKTKTAVPQTVAQTIPYVADFDNGLFEVTEGHYSKSYMLSDINYSTFSDDEQANVFLAYASFLNYFDEDITFQVTIDNRVVSMSEMEEKIFYKQANDGYDAHREEYNNILAFRLASGRNKIQQNKYITVTVKADTPVEALLRFCRLDSEISKNIRRTGASVRAMTTPERLELLHDKFRPGHEGQFHIDFDHVKKCGLSSKDYIAPTSFYFGKPKDFMIGDHFCRVLTVANLPSSLDDTFITTCAENEFPLIITKTIQPVAQGKALRLVRRQLTGMEANRIEQERKAVRAGYSPDILNHDLAHSLSQAAELLDDLVAKDQRMFFVTLTMMVYGKSLEELEENVETLKSTVQKYSCSLRPLAYQQESGFKLTLPLGHDPRVLSVETTLTSESTAVFMPFSSQEIFDSGGFYYGLNQISRNLIMLNRTTMKTPSGFILGSSGSGKSFAAKREMINVILHDGRTGLLAIDPEGEYVSFFRAFGGTVVKLSADSTNYINPLDMPEEYGLDDDDGENTTMEVKKAKALRKKSDYMMSIIERMLSHGDSANAGGGNISPQQKTIIDRCVKNCYQEYLSRDFDIEYLPTLIDFQEELEKEEGSDARLLAEAVAYYSRGSMDIFSHKTNVDMVNRLVCFNLRDLSEQLRPIASLIMFDFVWNRMIENKGRGVRTYCYADEVHTMFSNFHSAHYLKQFYKRGRKYGLVITGITQNIQELLRSEIAQGMVGNSDFLLMLSQSSEDLRILSAMLNLSPEQSKYINNADPGYGLLRAEDIVVPFADEFPVDSNLYSLMTTNFNESVNMSDVNMNVSEQKPEEAAVVELAVESEPEIDQEESFADLLSTMLSEVDDLLSESASENVKSEEWLTDEVFFGLSNEAIQTLLVRATKLEKGRDDLEAYTKDISDSRKEELKSISNESLFVWHEGLSRIEQVYIEGLHEYEELKELILLEANKGKIIDD